MPINHSEQQILHIFPNKEGTLPNIPEIGKGNFNVDEIMQKGNRVILRGWCFFINNDAFAEAPSSFIVAKDDSIYAKFLPNESRYDVSEYYSSKLKLGHDAYYGYHISIDLQNSESLWLYAENKSGELILCGGTERTAENSYLSKNNIKQIFSPHVHEIINKNNAEIFTHIYKNNDWTTNGSRSGVYSQTNEFTKDIRLQFPKLIKKYQISSVTDAPCGEATWISELFPVIKKYHGVDIVADVIKTAKCRYGAPQRTFEVADITHSCPWDSDLLICRDLLMHVSFKLIRKILENFCNSSIKYFLISQADNVMNTIDIHNGDVRPINLFIQPFRLPKPLEQIIEVGGAFHPLYIEKRSMCLWSRAQIQSALKG